jgi:type I restriction enzyme S subunit
MPTKIKTTAADVDEEAKPALVPKLRFPSFTDTWAHDPLWNVLTEQKRKNSAGREVFSVSMEHGIVNQIELLGRSFAASDTSHYTVGRRYDIVYTKSPLKAFPFGIVKQCKYDGDVALSPLYGVFTPPNPHLGLMIEAYFESPDRSKHFLSPLCQKGAKNTLQITNATFLSGKLPLPTEPGEQQKIAECLSSLDELIAAQARKVEVLKTHKKGLMQQLFPREGETQPRLRFPEFEDAGEWVESTVEEFIATVTPPKKLQAADYGTEGEFPIIDQSQDAICGWTNDRDALISEGLPVIVFGDHTCALKFIDHPFVQGADGIKIFRPKRGIALRFLFCALEANPVVQETYKRHFSMLKEKTLSFPDPKTGEQQRIATCLSSLDALITAETQKHTALQLHKRGLMQQLFPDPEEVEA